MLRARWRVLVLTREWRINVQFYQRFYLTVKNQPKTELTKIVFW